MKNNLIYEDNSGNFYYEVACNRVEKVREKIEKEKINPNIQVRLNDTSPYRPLLLAAILNGAQEMVGYLLSIGADINTKDKKGSTALMIAAKEKLPGIAALLLKAGADKSLTTSAGKTALDLTKSEAIKQMLMSETILTDENAERENTVKEFTVRTLEIFHDRKMPKAYQEFIDSKAYEQYERKKFPLPDYGEIEIRFAGKDENGNYLVPGLLMDDGDFDDAAAENLIPFAAIHYPDQDFPEEQFLLIDSSKPACPVVMYEHETGGFTKIAKSMAEFLKTVK